MNYSKTYTSPTELIELLAQRGLECGNPDEAERFLNSIGYYRFSGYLYPFLKHPKEHHLFKEGSSLSVAICLYEFDRKLRQLIFD